MLILISIAINIIILAVILPLFYIYMTYKARERLEKEIIKKAKEEIEALVKEFNHVAISNITILEDSILRAKKMVDKIDDKLLKHGVMKDNIDQDIKNTKKYDKYKSLNIETEEKSFNIIKKEKDKAKKSKIQFNVDEPLVDSIKDIYKNETIMKLYKNGSTVEDIALALGCSITEINLMLDMQKED